MSRRISPILKEAIWERYAPRIGVVEAVEATETEKEIKGNPGKIDPKTLYVGPLLD